MSKNWTTAQTMCQDIGGQLWEPRNLLENQKVAEKGFEIYGTSIELYIGINDIANEGSWIYASDNSSLKFTSWNPGQPNGDGNCARISARDNQPGVWWDGVCSSSLKFICEFQC